MVFNPTHATQSPAPHRRSDNATGGPSRDDGEWTDFDSSSFSGSIKQSRKKGTDRVAAGKRGAVRSSATPSVTPSWMKAPINSDASWIPLAPPLVATQVDHRLTINEHEGDDAPREGPELIAPPSPAVRRRAARQEQNLHDEYESRNDKELGTISSSSQYPRRSGLAHGVETQSRDANGTPVRRGRTTTRVPSEPRPRSNSRSSPAYITQTQDSRTRPSTPTGRGRSRSHTPAAGNRPARMALAERSPELIQAVDTGCSSSVGRKLPRPTRTPRVPRSAGDERSVRTMESARTLDANIGRNVTFGSSLPPKCEMSPMPARKEGGFMEKLFGTQGGDEAKKMLRRESSLTTGSDVSFRLPQRIHTRILLSATVYHNTATNLWITTINTNQRGVNTNPAAASKFLKAFSFSSEKEARESAIANAPPKMLPFSENENCFICSGKFAVFRRPSHCRNCGVCICSGCTTTWPSRMIPEMYNLKNETNVNICNSCDWLSYAFKKALIKGDIEEIIALYGTGNINVRSPFPAGKRDKKGETMHPIHCAVEGGNLNVLRWLLEERFCPVKRIASGNGKQKRGEDIPILTSKGRSVLSIAMTNLNVEIVRYLVIDKNVSVYEIKDLALCLRVLESALVSIPRRTVPLRTRDIVARWADDGYAGDVASDISGSIHEVATHNEESTFAGSRCATEVGDACIICYDRAIDCVITPCGHQICCMACAENMRSCPVCNTECAFIRIFKP